MNLTQEQRKEIEVAIKVLTETLNGQNTVTRMTIAQSCFTLKEMLKTDEEIRLEAKWKAQEAYDAMCEENGIQQPKC